MALSTIFATLLFAPALIYLLQAVIGLARNYLAVRNTGLPILVNPLSLTSPLWLLGKGLIVALTWPLPAPLSEWTRRIDSGWNQHFKFDLYARHRSLAFWIIGPAERTLYVADPAAAEDIFRRARTDFPKNREVYWILELYGPSVITVNDKSWERHRRVTVPPFNDRVAETVWEESGRQVEGARRKWMGAGDVRSSQNDATRIAFNVLMAAGFGLSYSFDDAADEPDVGEGSGWRAARAENGMVYHEAMSFMLGNVMLMVLANMITRQMSWAKNRVWGGVREMFVAKEFVGQCLQEMILQERKSGAQGEKPGRETLMSALVRTSDQGTQGGSSTGSKSGPILTDDEVYGNLFGYNVAGHDTTANTMHFAITLLALEPRWQQWLADEVDAVLSEDGSSLKYAAVFPKLSRCQALMYETLRMFGPVVCVPRWTATSAQRLTINGKEVMIPPNSELGIDLAALHHNPDHWADPQAFRPDRWIPQTAQKEHNEDREQDADRRQYDWQSSSLVSPKPGTFLPWTGGPRVCPGKKFSQVEFTRVMLGLFSNGGRVQLVQDDGESAEGARARARRILDEARVSFTLKIPDGERIGLQWYSIAE